MQKVDVNYNPYWMNAERYYDRLWQARTRANRMPEEDFCVWLSNQLGVKIVKDQSDYWIWAEMTDEEWTAFMLRWAKPRSISQSELSQHL